jgi:hypothetical protein
MKIIFTNLKEKIPTYKHVETLFRRALMRPFLGMTQILYTACRGEMYL